ncbi:uncharacterized protein DUF4190 [Frondihabitans sp. PhB188]|uniref:DUF4190 domain-containing protein n=1 Tax=Frondihabitans sp. PhB188 TaxID=2485200 RepID=UPI000F475896|nr:DUF4190 domain-containing protein [Frondihabitans sp. PhB188]ROQ30279.1 uncharacterized protein DUF4190 [Frondihabitans sp. PhB188]
METTHAESRWNSLSIAAFVLAFVLSWVGIVLGFVAKAQIRRTQERGTGLATAAIVVGFVEIGLFLLGAVLFATVNSGPHT